MASNISNILNNKIRLTGMASGLDTESMIQKLMSAERVKVDRVKQDRDLLEWRRDNYREITNALRGLQDDFLNFLKPTSNMRSLSTYSIYNTTSTNTAVATASGGAGVTSTNHTLEVIQLANASTGSSTAAVTKSLAGSTVDSFNVDGYNKTLVLNYNGTSKEIVLPDGSYTDAASIIGNGSDGKLQQLVQQAFGGNVTVSDAGGKLQLGTANASDVLTINTKYATGDNLLSTIGVSSTGVGSTLSFTTPLSIKKGMKFEVTTVEAGVASTKTIQWDADKSYSNIDELKLDLQNRIDTALGVSGKLNITAADNKLTFTAGTGLDSFSLANCDIVKDLGFQSGDSNKLSLGDTMDKVSSKLASGGITFDGSGKFTLTINNTNIDIYKTDSLSSFLSKINNSAAGVNISYSSNSDTFTMTNKSTGASTISINDNGSGFFSAISLTSAAIQAGQDASFKLDGIAGSRSTNSFISDGVTYNMASIGTTTINLAQNTDEIFNKISAFVNKYNEVIGKINGELAEKHDRNFKPLTEDQKAAMKDDEIKIWEEKAKTGLLSNDSALTNIASSMRRALFEPINGIDGGLSSIGIKTSSYQDKGKLSIDEVKLREVIKNNPDKVISIFTKESSISYNDTVNGSGSRTDRYNDTGIANRLNDIIQDNIRSTRDKYGMKGTLLEKAGIIGDLSETKNIINKQIDDKEKQISSLENLLSGKEDMYYKQFAAMESAISKMNSQSSWIAQQLGGGQ